MGFRLFGDSVCFLFGTRGVLQSGSHIWSIVLNHYQQLENFYIILYNLYNSKMNMNGTITLKKLIN